MVEKGTSWKSMWSTQRSFIDAQRLTLHAREDEDQQGGKLVPNLVTRKNMWYISENSQPSAKTRLST